MTYRNRNTIFFSLQYSAKRLLILMWLCGGLFFATNTNGVSADITVGNEYVVNHRITENADSIDFDGGSLLVTGDGSTLTVKGSPTKPSGTGYLAVTGEGTLMLNETGEIAFNGNALFDNGYLNQKAGTLLDVGNGRIDFDNASVATAAGTLSAAYGVFVNDYSILNIDGATGQLTVDGNLYFSGNSTLGVLLDANGNSGKIDAQGNNVALDGNLVVTPDYGYYGATQLTSKIIVNGNNISGTFADGSFQNSRFGTLDDVIYGTNEVAIKYTPSATPYSSFTQTFNERNVGKTFDTIHQQQLPDFLPFMRETWTMSDAELRALYNDLSGEIRAETMAMPLAAPGRKAFDRVTWDSGNGHVAFGPQYRLAATGTGRAAWFRPYYVNDRVKSDGNASRYTTEGYGFVGGLDQTLTGGKTAVGVMLGYGRPELKSRNDTAKLDDFLIGAYFATRIMNAYELKAWGGYGYQYYDMQRQVNLMGTPQTFKSSFKGHTVTVSGELSRPIYTMSRLVLKPTVGYDGLFLTQDAGDETGNNLTALAYNKTKIERHIGRIGINAEYGDSARSLYGGAHYKYLLGGDRMYYSQASFVGGGPAFVVEGVDLGKAFISANIGLQINLSDDRSRLIFVDYTADFGDNSAYYQMATVGLQQTF